MQNEFTANNNRMLPTICSIPLYSPSVFSLIVTIFTLSYAVSKPGIDLHGLTLAKRLNVLWNKGKCTW